MSAHVTYKLAFAVLLVTIALSTIWIITSDGPRIDPAKAQIIKEIESSIAAQKEQSASFNLIGDPTGDDNLRAMNEAKANREKMLATNFIIIFATCLDLSTLITVIAASRARTIKVLLLLALIAALIGELVVVLTHPVYTALSFFPHRIAGQVIVAFVAYSIFCKYRRVQTCSEEPQSL